MKHFILFLTSILFCSFFVCAQEVSPLYYNQNQSTSYQLSELSWNYGVSTKQFDQQIINIQSSDPTTWSESQLLARSDLFMSDAYIDYIDHLLGYESTLDVLHEQFHNASFYQRLWWWIKGSYSAGLQKRICSLHAKKQKEKQVQLKGAQEQCKIDLAPLCNTWRTQLCINNVSHRTRLQNRLNAVNQSIDQASKTPLINHFYVEFSDIAKQTSVLKKQSINSFQTACLQSVEDSVFLADQALELHNIVWASRLADFCWILLDACQAVGQGVLLGAENAFHTVMHPIETAHNIVSCVVTISNGFARTIGIARECTYLYVADQDAYFVRRDEIIQNLTQIYENTADLLHNCSLHDGIKYTTAFIADGFFFHQFTKIAHQLTKQLIPAAQSAIRLIKESQKTVLVTADSQIKLIEVANPMENLLAYAAPIEPVVGKVSKYTCTYENLINPHTDLKQLAAKFNGRALKNKIDHFIKNSITVNYEHIFARQLKWRRNKTGLESINCSIHHDYLNYFENNGKIQLTNKVVCPKTKHYKANLLVEGMKKSKECTFFPAEWHPDQVMESIYEAIEDTFRTLEVDYRGDTIITGKTSQGVQIKIVLNSDKVVLTAYPML